MNIKVLALRKIEKEGSRFKGIAQVVVNDAIVVDDVRIIQGPESMFIAMPSKKVEDKYFDYAHPTNPEAAAQLKETVINAYNENGHESGEKEEIAITSIKIKNIPNETGVVAVAHVVLNNCFALHDLMLVKELSPDGKYKARLLMPTRDDGEGNRRNIFFPTSKEVFEKLLIAILEEYKKGLNG